MERALPELDREDLLGIYRNLLVTRGIEERGHILYKQGKIPGSFYTGRGNEGAAVGVATAMGPNAYCCDVMACGLSSRSRRMQPEPTQSLPHRVAVSLHQSRSQNRRARSSPCALITTCARHQASGTTRRISPTFNVNWTRGHVTFPLAPARRASPTT